MSEEIWDLTEARQRMYMQELERCKNEDCDFYLEHNDVDEFYDYITNLQEENERLNNIIKEVREYVNKNINRDFLDLEHSGEVTIKLEIKGLLEILDKVGSE